MSSAVDKLVKDNEKNEEKEKDDAKKSKEKGGKKPDADKLLKEKKNIGYFDITGQQLKKDLSSIDKEHKINKLKDAQKMEKDKSDTLKEEGQQLEDKYSPIINKYQERAQMAQSEADREYEQRIIEYIQRMYQSEKEIIDKQLMLMQQNQQAREKGLASTDQISNLQVEAKAAMDKYDEDKDKLSAMIKARQKQEKEANGELDKSQEDKKEENKEKNNDKKTLDIGGLKNVDNEKLDAGDLKDKKEAKKKSFLGF